MWQEWGLRLPFVLTIVQTVAIVIASLASAYAIADTEAERRRAARKSRVERLMDAMLALAEEAASPLPRLEVPRRRLRAELRVTGVKGFEGVDIMTRDRLQPGEIVSQSESGMIEIAHALNKLEPRPLIGLIADRLRASMPRRSRVSLRHRHSH